MKLHLGCGKKYIAGFVHVDMLDYPHIDYQTSVDKLFFAADNSVDLIYASHILEHFGRREFQSILKEWHRVLKKEGVLRISVPSFESIVKHYVQHADLEVLLGLIVGGQKVGEFDYHKMIFDKTLPENELKLIGFDNIKEYNWKTTEHSNIDDFSQAYLPHLVKKNGMLMSLNLEAVKQ